MCTSHILQHYKNNIKFYLRLLSASLYLFVCLCIHTYRMCVSHITYSVAMRFYFDQLDVYWCSYYK